jgi:lysyl-tRNA synthetase, class I
MDAQEEVEDPAIMGRGTWLDRVANEVISREKSLGRDLSLIRVESGLGASGIPHIGSLGDAARAYGVKMGLEEAGFSSELLAYSDDMDALRKVPAGMPERLKDDIGKPVSEIKDPEGCHDSYGQHMSALLLDGLDRVGFHYRFQSGYQAYRSGLLVNQVDAILRNAKTIGEQIEELTGQKKYLETLPYFPLCSNCHRLNVAHSESYDPATKRVHYKCVGDEIGNSWLDGCGNEGDSDITKGEGKLSWKVEFAARWAAFDIRFEAHGKELTDSVRINDWICDNILGHPHPYHIVYELFQDKGGKKFSKSTGNLVTPQEWLRYASSQSLLLMYYKRIVGARNISVEDCPIYMDDYDYHEDIFFGKRTDPNKMKEARLKGVYYYSNLRRPPNSPSQHVPYRLLVELASVAPPGNLEAYVSKRLIDYRAVNEVDDKVLQRISYAINWSKEFKLANERVSLSSEQKNAIVELAAKIEQAVAADDIQTMIFSTAKSHGFKNPEFFELLYEILLGTRKGPRLGPYILDIGPGKVAQKLKETADDLH